MRYTVKVSTDFFRNDVIPVYKVAEAMARQAAAGHGPSLKRIRPAWYALLLEDARAGKLLVCDSVGRVASAQDLIQAYVAPANWPKEDFDVHHLYVRVKHLNDWGVVNGDEFQVVNSPGKVFDYDLKDWETGKVLIPGYHRAYVDWGEEPEEPQAAPEQPANTVPAPLVEVSLSGSRPLATVRELMKKRAALIKAHLHEWRDIESDLNDASDNGLSSAAKVPKHHGMWYVERAREWANERGKLTESKAPATRRNSAFAVTDTDFGA